MVEVLLGKKASAAEVLAEGVVAVIDIDINQAKIYWQYPGNRESPIAIEFGRGKDVLKIIDCRYSSRSAYKCGKEVLKNVFQNCPCHVVYKHWKGGDYIVISPCSSIPPAGCPVDVRLIQGKLQGFKVLGNGRPALHQATGIRLVLPR